jgi:hypothetical protein
LVIQARQHRTTIENLFGDIQHDAALRHPPRGYPR